MDFLHPVHAGEPQREGGEPDRKELEARFQEAMAEMYREARIRCRHDSPLFARMMNKRGGLSAARRLINTCKLPDEFILMRDAGCLERTVEALALREEFRPLFSERERRKAAERLREHGYREETAQ